jgi:hypothetical protein
LEVVAVHEKKKNLNFVRDHWKGKKKRRLPCRVQSVEFYCEVSYGFCCAEQGCATAVARQ